MNQKNKILYLLLSFLPIILYGFSPMIGLFSAILILGFSMLTLKDEDTYKDVLKPLVLVLCVSIAYFSLSFVFNILHGFGNMWNFYSISNFKIFLDKFLIMFNVILMFILAGGFVLILLGLKNNKKVFILSDLVDAIITGTCPFKKKTAQTNKKESEKTTEEKKETEEAEVIIEENDEDNK